MRTQPAAGVRRTRRRGTRVAPNFPNSSPSADRTPSHQKDCSSYRFMSRYTSLPRATRRDHGPPRTSISRQDRGHETSSESSEDEEARLYGPSRVSSHRRRSRSGVSYEVGKVGQLERCCSATLRVDSIQRRPASRAQITIESDTESEMREKDNETGSGTDEPLSPLARGRLGTTSGGRRKGGAISPSQLGSQASDVEGDGLRRHKSWRCWGGTLHRSPVTCRPLVKAVADSVFFRYHRARGGYPGLRYYFCRLAREKQVVC